MKRRAYNAPRTYANIVHAKFIPIMLIFARDTCFRLEMPSLSVYENFAGTVVVVSLNRTLNRTLSPNFANVSNIFSFNENLFIFFSSLLSMKWFIGLFGTTKFAQIRNLSVDDWFGGLYYSHITGNYNKPNYKIRLRIDFRFIDILVLMKFTSRHFSKYEDYSCTIRLTGHCYSRIKPVSFY